MMAAEALGGRLLNDVTIDSLEDVLGDLRKLSSENGTSARTQRLSIQGLDDIWARHGGRLEITGRDNGLPLLYHVVSAVVSSPQEGAIVVIDVDGKFDISRLFCSYEDLKHVHLLRPSPSSLEVTLKGVEHYMIYGGSEALHMSMARGWVATIVCGGTGGDIMSRWRGWLKVQSTKEDVVGFGLGMSVEEAVAERDARQMVLADKGWKAISEWGIYSWTDG